MLASDKITIFDTTLRDGELAPGVSMTLEQKSAIAEVLDGMGVDVIEVGYPGHFEKDFEEMIHLSKVIQHAQICGLAGSKTDEIMRVFEALQLAQNPRIHIYTPVNLKGQSHVTEEQVLEAIAQSVSLARNHCDDVEWGAFDAPRSDINFLCRAVETAIQQGATTINIPDSMGLLSPHSFSELLTTIFNQVPNIDQSIVAVHCHDDLGKAVDNSIAALECGARQIECSINGLGARHGNADLAVVITRILNHTDFTVQTNPARLQEASALVSAITKIDKEKPKS
ncbi:MAG: hypothetical protein SFY66_21585 [Oculatellaceae cyanobacterium bins.114]|nr:hypothetical protein [Oculatellaceae cyanobacterium bins.114]